MTVALVSLGDVRSDVVPSAYALGNLRTAATLIANARPSALPNPVGSPGCSPVLRALLVQSGLAFAVQAELLNDGQPYGHAGGNALDITGSDRQLSVLMEFIRSMPTLFSLAASGPIGGADLMIWDGALIPAGSRSTAMTAFVTRCIDHVHLASSARRLMATLGAASGALADYVANDGSAMVGTPIADSASLVGVSKQPVQRW